MKILEVLMLLATVGLILTSMIGIYVALEQKDILWGLCFALSFFTHIANWILLAYLVSTQNHH